jgi:hypothetical protein
MLIAKAEFNEIEELFAVGVIYEYLAASSKNNLTSTNGYCPPTLP